MSEVEHKIEVIPIDANIQKKLESLEIERWQVVPGVQPVAIYHLVRMKVQPSAQQGAFGQIKVDETKVHVLRDGKMIQ